MDDSMKSPGVNLKIIQDEQIIKMIKVKEKLKKKTRAMLQLAALFCSFIIINVTMAHALVISHNPNSDVDVTGTEATIRWTTDNSSDSQVDYGEDPGLGSSESESTSVTNHSVTLTGLGAATTYYYKLASSSAGETATADNSGSLYSLTTAASTDNTPPQFNVTLPEYYNRRQLTFGGFTEPDSILRLYINADAADIGTDKYSQLTTSDASGHFIFKYVNLQEDNNIVIWAKDRAGNTNTETFTMKLDLDRPVVTMTELPGLAASTSVSLNGTVDEDVTLTYSVNNDTNTQELTAGSFNLQINLDEGIKNNIDMQFADKAGNVFEREYAVDVDTTGPKILWHNLRSLDPSYIQEVEIKGNVSKPGATVVVFVNNKTRSSESWSTSVKDTVLHLGSLLAEGDEEYSTTAGKDGSFKIKVFLTQEIDTLKTEYQRDPYQTSPTSGEILPGGAPVTAGTSQTATGTVTAGATGRYANAWDNYIKIVVIDELGRTDETSGDDVITFARCGFGADWNIQAKDPTPSVIIPEHLRQGIAQIAFAVDLDWQGRGDKQNMLQDPIIQQYKLSDEIRQNYVFDPNELVAGIHPLWNPERTKGYIVIELNKKDYEQKRLSELKKEDLLLKLPMQIELQYSYDDGSGNTVTSVQRQCWDISTALDVKVPPSVIPKQLLNSSVIFLNATINAINRLLKPLKAITIVTFVTCLLSWVVYFFALTKKAYDCMGDKEKKSESCRESIESAKKVEKKMHLVCDRIFCPSVPTADFYFSEMAGEDCIGKPLTPGMNKNDNACGQEYMDQWDSACLLMNELERSKCIRADAGDSRFRQSCSESGQALKNIWYGASDFCRKKDVQTARRISIRRGNEVEQYVIDEQGRAHRITSEVTVEEDVKKKGKYVTAGKGGAKSTYATGPFGSYSEGGKKYDDQITYDEEGRLYYPTGNKYEDDPSQRQYLCENPTTGRLQPINPKPDGGFQTKTCGGNNPATLPRELMDIVNLPQTRKYVVNPTDNLLTSLQCVCLPAINGFLVMWRNILGAIMQCFQSILITGDGSAGVCRSVLTTYVCDIIFSAIRCFVNKYGAGAGPTPDAKMGISKFFKSVATAGGDIQKSITGRYGETGLYNTMFNERKLIHAACLFAFTGDFDFDLESALTGAGAIPLKSKAFLYPRTRRYISSNPITGEATHIYHIGAGLVAGADIGYKLQLVCSNTADCDIQEGFPNGNCDCFKEGKEIVRDITYTFGPGRLIAGEMLGPNEGDIYVRIEDKIRYDKVRLTYWEENKAPISEEQKITQVGGKPPADCAFDAASGQFKCAYDIGDNGYAIFSEAPVPTEKVYGLGDTINLDFKVDKRSPQKPRDDSTYAAFSSYDQIPFYLRYTVTGPAGDSIGEKVIPIIPDGIQDFKGRSIPGIRVSEELLMGRGAGKDYIIPSEKPPKAQNIINPLNYDSGGMVGDPISFGVYIRQTTKKDAKPEDKEFDGRVCEGEFTQRTVKGEIKDVYKESSKCITLSGKEDEKGSLSFETQPLKRSIRIVYNGIKMDVRFPAPLRKKSSWGGFIMQYKPTNTEATIDCLTRYTTAAPAVVSIKIGLYPCQKKDDDLDKSISNCEASSTPVNYFGTVQEYDVGADAICSDSPEGTPIKCSYNALALSGCECRGEIVGRDNCGEDDKNYCMFLATEPKCMEYSSCTRSTPGNLVKIDNSGVATPIKKGEDTYYCDCNGDGEMKDCTNQYCYNGKQGWACYANPP